MIQKQITLESRFVDLDEPVLLSGIQALLRLLIEQKRLDTISGINTNGFVSGYRGSPLAGLDKELWTQKSIMSSNGIRFEPGINEDLAATMLMGTQKLNSIPGPLVDGVYGMWYGKGPGVDRSGDAFHCANMLGTHKNGGVLAVAGDDHGAHSSTYPHQTEYIFQNSFIPVFNPSSVQDILDLGLAGWALSRYSGLWVALKTTAETVEQTSTVIVRSNRSFMTPDFVLPLHGLNIDHSLSFPGSRVELERRMVNERIPAAIAWAKANHIDRLIKGNKYSSIGIITVGKAHEDLLHSLCMLGLDNHPQIAIYKIGMSWPLETDGIKDFAKDKRTILIIEEKRSFVEAQIRDALYNVPANRRPEIGGKTTTNGEPLLSSLMELSPESISKALVKFLGSSGINLPNITDTLAIDRPNGLLKRAPAFCAGCPHATSTKLPEGSFATAGIGCHIMIMDDSPETVTFSHMGGEGVSFVGLANFTETKHMFANIGDGTYQHSGILAIRQAVASKTKMTYKLLYNDAAAMTGGQLVEGSATVPMIANQLAAEGVKRIAIIADEEDRLPDISEIPAGTTLHTRDELDAVQRDLREYNGLSVLIYDQVCATEKRRRRKKGSIEQASKHIMINEEVCENCGDCSVQSSCIAIEPVDTPLGRKRRINPTSCNVDLSCLKGFCPSFVTLDGPPHAPIIDTRWQDKETDLESKLIEPILSPFTIWRGLFAGIGGGGIITSGAILAMAAHLEGYAVKTLDFTGLAQKNGAVVAHVQIAINENLLDVVRIPVGSADVMLAADLAVGCQEGVLERNSSKSVVIGNLNISPTAEFKRYPLLPIDDLLHVRTINKVVDATNSVWVYGVQIAEKLFGNAQAMNTILLGIAWQKGLLPVRKESILTAIELNGVSVTLNERAFLWGRLLADNEKLASEILDNKINVLSINELLVSRGLMLREYQSDEYMARYLKIVQDIIEIETNVMGEIGKLSRTVTENLYHLMAYKDEYEVARLHSKTTYGKGSTFHMSPPLIARMDKSTGRRRKIAIPGWIAIPMFKVLKYGKILRGTIFDPFGIQTERRNEINLITQYISDLQFVINVLNKDTFKSVLELASLPDLIRGFGHVKEANISKANSKRIELLSLLRKTLPLT